jgi:competence protein ComEA
MRLLARALLCACALAGALPCLAGVEVNTATEAELDSVRGLGPSSTARILEARQQGPFKDWADLMHRVKGIRAFSAARLSDNGLTVNAQTYPSKEK